nr:unnamed protein product [Digitaria exilis]
MVGENGATSSRASRIACAPSDEVVQRRRSRRLVWKHGLVPSTSDGTARLSLQLTRATPKPGNLIAPHHPHCLGRRIDHVDGTRPHMWVPLMWVPQVAPLWAPRDPATWPSPRAADPFLLSRPSSLARQRPGLLSPLPLSSFSDKWAPPVGTLFLLAPCQSRTRVRVPAAPVLPPRLGAHAKRRPDPSCLSTRKPQLLAANRASAAVNPRLSLFEIADRFRVEVRNSPSLFSLSRSLELTRARRRNRLSPLLNPPSSQASNRRKPSSQALVSTNSGELPAERRRRLNAGIQRPRSSPFRVKPSIPFSRENGPFEGDQDQVYEEEQPQCFEEGNDLDEF